ncbi:MAG TPA: hypothetical protein VHW23_46895 [Kofleriaceae bacterium]|jgi:hypothetical protein|nr:hypothetical protein [Kofleriaceae bacterium]
MRRVDQASFCTGDGCDGSGGGGGASLCDEWDACYRACHADICSSPTSCAAQQHCYQLCDDLYPSASQTCSYPF